MKEIGDSNEVCKKCGEHNQAIVLRCRNCASESLESQTTAVQQLKAEIASLVVKFDRCIRDERDRGFYFSDVVEELRQLSAV